MMPYVKMSTDELRVRAIKRITKMSRSDLLLFFNPELKIVAPRFLVIDEKKIIDDICSLVKRKGLSGASSLLSLSAGPLGFVKREKSFPKGHHKEATRCALERYKINNMGVL